MKNKLVSENTLFDFDKYQTTKDASEVVNRATLSSVPDLDVTSAIVESTEHPSTETRASKLPALKGKLIISPDAPGDSLILYNDTVQDITIERFYASKLVIDGYILNCNDICLLTSVTIPAKQEVSVQFTARVAPLHKENTRIVPVIAQLKCNTAVISEVV